jgi:metal-responsive CopG/Arc/MetJ family transcriptional regulator
MSDVTKVTVNLPSKVVEELQELAKREGTSLTNAIRQSIQINNFLSQQEAEKGKVLIETPDGKFQRLIRK